MFLADEPQEDTMPFMLKLPEQRGEQLRQIAAAKNTTIPDLIAGYIRAEITAGTIPAAVPGIEVAADGAAITIRAQAFEASVPMGSVAQIV